MKECKQNALVPVPQLTTRASSNQEPLRKALYILNIIIMSQTQQRLFCEGVTLMTKIEKETIIIFNEAEPSATLYTCSDKLIRQMEEKILSAPDQFKLMKIYKDSEGKEYARDYLLCFKSSVSIRAKRTISPERSQALRDHMKKIRSESQKGASA